MNMTPIYRRVYRWFLVLPVVLLSACGSPEERAQSYYDRGIALIEKKDDFAARLELLNAIKYKSDKIEAWRALAGINERVKAWDLLFQNLRRVVELDPNDIEARIKLSDMLFLAKAPEAALRILDEAKVPVDKNASFHALRAKILAATQDIPNAIVEAQKAIEIDPSEIDAALFLSAERLFRGDTDGALQPLLAAPIASKDDFRVNALKVQIFVRKNDLGQAESLLRKLIEQRPQETVLRSQLVQILGSQRRFDEAEAQMRAIAKANPDNSKAELDVVRLISGVKGLESGKEELENRIKAGGDVFTYQMALADVNFAQGKFAEGQAVLEGLIAAKDLPEHTSAAQAKLAEYQLRQANYPAAEALADAILQKDQRNISGLKIRAAIRLNRGQTEGAISDLREALNGNPKSPELLLLMALAYEKDGKMELAERQYADALKSSSSNAGVVLGYVQFLQRQGKIAQAEDILTDAVSRNPRSLDILSMLANAKLARQNWKGALATADAIKDVGNDRGSAAQIRGVALFNLGKSDESVAAFEEAHASAPDAIQPAVFLAIGYLKAGKPDKSEALLNEMLKKYPQNPQLIELMGSAQLARSNFSEAERSYKAVIALQPKDPVGYRSLSNAYSTQKKYDEASNIIREGLREHPGDLGLQLALAGLLVSKGDNDGAIASYEAILKAHPNQLVAVNNLTSLLLDYRTSASDLDSAYSLAEGLKNSKVPEFQDTYGWARYRKGDYPTAIAALEDAQKKSPDIGSIRYHLGMVYNATGQAEKAQLQLKEALRLEPEGSPLKEKIKSALK
jgi:cellulose synthase operon protein C